MAGGTCAAGSFRSRRMAGQAQRGALAQLGERLICIQEVRSSILLGSTISAWGRSSAGRALQSHCRGRRFDPARLHQDHDLTVKHLRVLHRPIGRIDIVQRDTITTLFDRPE